MPLDHRKGVYMRKKPKTITEYRPYTMPSNFPVLFLSGDKWHISDIKSNHLHFHNCLEIGICLSQSGYMEFEGVPVAFQEGDISCVPYNMPHTTYSSPGELSLWTYIFLHPDELFHNMFPGNAAPISNLSMVDIPNFRFIYPKKDFPKIYFLATSIAGELEQKPENYQITVRSLLLALCIEIRRCQDPCSLRADTQPHSDLRDGKMAIAPALDYIHKNYMQEFSIKDLADICHLSETHFRRIFHSIMGMPPLEFVNNTRIYHACNLLKNTEESILYISGQVGFNSVSTFNRCFSKAMGTNPRDWKKNVLFEEGKTDLGAVEKYPGWI